MVVLLCCYKQHSGGMAPTTTTTTTHIQVEEVIRFRTFRTLLCTVPMYAATFIYCLCTKNFPRANDGRSALAHWPGALYMCGNAFRMGF